MAFDDAFIDRLFHLESSNNPTAVTGSNRGLGQFSPNLERKYGIIDWKDPGQQRAAVRREMDEFAPVLSKTLGRDPTPGEGYLAHQQGLSGALAHFDNPDGTAWQNVRRYYPSDRIAKEAIWGNIPDRERDSPNFHKGMFPGGVDDVTSGHFANGWVSKFEGSPAAQPGGSAVAGAAPVGAPPVADSAAITGGMLAGADVSSSDSSPGTSPDFGATIGRISQTFRDQDQPAPVQWQPIRYPVPAALRKRMQGLLG